MLKKLILILLILAPTSGARAAILDSDQPQNASPATVQAEENDVTEADDQSDHRAKVLSVSGDVKLLKKDTSSWTTVVPETLIGPGDQIKTAAGSSVEISFDDTLLNLTRIEENTLASFSEIEPTKIELEDGTLFNALDGLSPESEYEVKTPTFVAGVRGTHFDVSFDQETQQFSASALPGDSEEGESVHTSRIFVRDPLSRSDENEIEVTSGNQIEIPRGQTLQRGFLKPAPPERMAAAGKRFAEMKQRIPDFAERRQQGRQKVEQKRREFEARGGAMGMRPSGPGGAPHAGGKGPHDGQAFKPFNQARGAEADHRPEKKPQGEFEMEGQVRRDNPRENQPGPFPQDGTRGMNQPAGGPAKAREEYLWRSPDAKKNQPGGLPRHDQRPEQHLKDNHQPHRQPGGRQEQFHRPQHAQSQQQNNQSQPKYPQPPQPGPKRESK